MEIINPYLSVIYVNLDGPSDKSKENANKHKNAI